jgi:subtilisin family serine protease
VDLSRIYQVQVPEGADLHALVAELEQDPAVEYAEPIFLGKPHVVPNDPFYSRQTHLPQTQAEDAWEIAKGDSNVIIAIVDTGVDWDHPDLAPIIWSNQDEVIDGIDNDHNGYVDDIRGWDFVTGVTGNAAAGEDGDVTDNDPMDFHGHGTHCSGIAAGVTNNGIGIASISWGCRVMPMRIGWLTSDGNGSGYSNWMAQAFIYATDNGASAISLSYGNSGKLIKDAAEYAHQNGVVVVTSAGNDDNEIQADGLNSLPSVIKVAAVNKKDQKSSFSTYGNWITVSAPGGDFDPGIYSTFFNDKYTYASGTSMASPFVAGLVGLVKSNNPNLSAAELIFQVVETADDIDAINPGYVGKMGTGRVNALRALTETVAPQPDVKLLTYTVNDKTTGNGNGVVDVGEMVQIAIDVQNEWGTANNLRASLEINDWAVTVSKGVADFGTVYGIENLDRSRVTNAADPFVLNINEYALPHRLLAKIVLTADGGYQQKYEFVMSISPAILYVDDAEIDVSPFYISVLDELGYSFDYWSRSLKGTPDNLEDFATVIWNCEWTFPSLEGTDRVALASFLNGGGSLFLSGQDVGWDLCDETPGNSDTQEFKVSGGASKVFYENYLHSRFLLDDSYYSTASGVVGDPISAGLSINIFQPGRDATNQYPDELEPIDGGVSIFNFENGSSGAVRFAGKYRVVNFGFGGFEAITDESTRKIIMSRVLNWLNGLEVKHTPLGDTEDTQHDYAVRVFARSTTRPITKAYLYWDSDGALPLSNRVLLEAENDTTYRASIPAQSGGEIIYTVFFENKAGYYNAYEFYHFKVGPDQIAPEIEMEPLGNTLDKFGPYPLSLEVRDNLSVDTTSVWAFFRKGEGAFDSTRLWSRGEDQFSGQLKIALNYADSIEYFVKAQDQALIPNVVETERKHFTIGIDNFEAATLPGWETNGWGPDTTFVVSGKYAITESPGRNLGAGENRELRLKSPLDLRGSQNAKLVFQHQYSFHRNFAFGYVEVSTDSGQTWEQLLSVTSLRRAWTQKEISLDAYLGKLLWLRFRVESLATANDRFDGWYIDDVWFRASVPDGVDSNTREIAIPLTNELRQNYPNPFNPHTQISFHLAAAGEVELLVFNLLGQKVRTLISGKHVAGVHMVEWDGRDDFGKLLSSGVYLYQIKSASFSQTRKMVWMK